MASMHTHTTDEPIEAAEGGEFQKTACILCSINCGLQVLPQADLRSRAILRTMKADEARHADHAEAAGARALPAPIPAAMASASRLMKAVAYRL